MRSSVSNVLVIKKKKHLINDEWYPQAVGWCRFVGTWIITAEGSLEKRRAPSMDHVTPGSTWSAGWWCQIYCSIQSWDDWLTWTMIFEMGYPLVICYIAIEKYWKWPLIGDLHWFTSKKHQKTLLFHGYLSLQEASKKFRTHQVVHNTKVVLHSARAPRWRWVHGSCPKAGWPWTRTISPP